MAQSREPPAAQGDDWPVPGRGGPLPGDDTPDAGTPTRVPMRSTRTLAHPTLTLCLMPLPSCLLHQEALPPTLFPVIAYTSSVCSHFLQELFLEPSSTHLGLACRNTGRDSLVVKGLRLHVAIPGQGTKVPHSEVQRHSVHQRVVTGEKISFLKSTLDQ